MTANSTVIPAVSQFNFKHYQRLCYKIKRFHGTSTATNSASLHQYLSRIQCDKDASLTEYSTESGRVHEGSRESFPEVVWGWGRFSSGLESRRRHLRRGGLDLRWRPHQFTLQVIGERTNKKACITCVVYIIYICKHSNGG